MTADYSKIEQLRAALPPFGSLSKLTKKSAKESAGPCPLCGGTDRFFVRDSKAYCRQCNIKGGDIIDWHCLLKKTNVAELLKKYGLNNGNGKPKVVKIYDYHNATGKMIHQTLRWEPGRDGKKKSFSQRRPDGKGNWIKEDVFKDFDPVLYRLPEIIKASEVIITEGEKDADKLAALGFTATTNPMGASNWRNHYTDYLKGKRVVIFPDNDDAGHKHLAKVARSLAGAGIEARVVYMPDGTRDVSDYIATFVDKKEAAERLALMIDGAEPYKPTEKTEADRRGSPPSKDTLQITSDELIAAKLTPACIVKNYLYCDVGALVGPGGTGKTTQILYEMACIALKRPLYGLDICRSGWCLYITAEDSREILVARLRKVMAAMDLTDDERQAVMDRVLLWDVTGETIKLIEIRNSNIELTTLPDAIVSAYQADPPVLVTFDPMASFGASEGMVNDNEQGIITAGRRIVRGLGCCVRFVAHTGKANARNKTTDQYTSRGGSALSDGSRMVAVMQMWQPGDERKLPPGLTHSPESSITFLARSKLSYAPPNLPLIWNKRIGWTFEHVTEIPVSDEEREKTILDQVERIIHSEVKAGHYHSKKSLEESMAKYNLSRAAVRSAVERLIAYGRVVMADLPKGVGKGGWKTYLTTAKLADLEKTSGELGENLGGITK